MAQNSDSMGRLISFRAPEELAAALETAARREFSTVSTIARLAAASEMRRRGLLDDERK